MVLTPPFIPTPFPGTLTKQQGKPAGGATRAASIVRTSRDNSNVPPAWSAGSANQGAGGANTIATDPLLRRTINQISRQTLNERTHEQTTHAARDKNSLPNLTGGRPFAATSATLPAIDATTPNATPARTSPRVVVRNPSAAAAPPPLQHGRVQGRGRRRLQGLHPGPLPAGRRHARPDELLGVRRGQVSAQHQG